MTLKPVLVGSLIAFASAIHAQPQQPQRQQGQQQMQQQQGELRLSNLKDMKAVNAKGEDIGEIGDVIIALNNGRVHAVVLERGGVLGVGA